MHWSATLMESAAADMGDVLEREPELGDFGFGVFDPRSKTSEQRAAELRRQREAIREPTALGQFLAARLWLRGFAKTKAQDKYGTSYGLKHVMQRNIDCYVTNGCFIAAAIAEGFIVRRIGDGPNASFNISAKAWRAAAREAASRAWEEAD
jgi:hypothetical protein